MQASQIPTKFPIPFANAAGGGYIRTIPQASQIGITNGAASLTDGFPPLNFLPVGSGGVPPFGQDMNGILKQITQWDQWQAAGGLSVYDSAFSTAVGGYPQGALIAAIAPGGLWLCLVDNNTSNPDTGGAGWLRLGALTTAVNYYVNASTGSDSNTGTSPGAAFATIQHAINVVSGFNFNGQAVTINVADGTYAPFSLQSALVGGGTLSIVGDNTTPSNCIISTSSTAYCVQANFNTVFSVSGFRVTNTTASPGHGLLSQNGAVLNYSNMDFGPCTSNQMMCDNGRMNVAGNYKISGSANAHTWCQSSGVNIVTPSFANTVTLTGTPAFSAGFAVAVDLGLVRAGILTTYTGSATGPRYGITTNGVIETNGAGATFFPGSSAGSANTGGQYA